MCVDVRVSQCMSDTVKCELPQNVTKCSTSIAVDSTQTCAGSLPGLENFFKNVGF